jgi:tRNA(fMet)-specific endonuclease VapC
MARYMLDTDTVSLAIRGQGKVGDQLLSHRPSGICVSAITVAELEYGVAARRSAKLKRSVAAFLGGIEVVPFDQAAASRFAQIAVVLSRQGAPIGNFDTLIAAHALSLQVTVVTNNVKHFGRVPGLKIENWY